MAVAQISISSGPGGRGTQLNTTLPPRPATPAPQVSAQILFIGNSLTYCNDLPGMVGALFAAHRQSVGLGQHAPGATSLMEHAKNPVVAQKISSRRWTYIVLQDQSALPTVQPQETLEAGRTLCELARKAGAVPVFYLTWGYPSDKPPGMDLAMQRNLTKAYVVAARASKALLAPVGPAWQAALEKDPKLKLYAANDYHPSPEGTYLTACVLYSVMTRLSPVGLPGTVTAVVNGAPCTLVNVPPARARFYQQVAWDTVQNFSVEKIAAP